MIDEVLPHMYGVWQTVFPLMPVSLHMPSHPLTNPYIIHLMTKISTFNNNNKTTTMSNICQASATFTEAPLAQKATWPIQIQGLVKSDRRLIIYICPFHLNCQYFCINILRISLYNTGDITMGIYCLYFQSWYSFNYIDQRIIINPMEYSN